MANLIDLTGATWVGNDSLNIPILSEKSLTFICDGTTYSSIKGYEDATMRAYLYYGDTVVTSEPNMPGMIGEWADDKYKTIQITGGTDVTDTIIISWLQENGTITGGVYEGDQATTLPTAIDYINELTNQKKTLANNLVEMGVEASEDEKFNTLIPKVLDIVTGITPTGTVTITTNGTHDVTNYANATVNVPIPDGYIKPEGSIEITENGEHDVTNYASVTVNVPVPTPTETVVQETGTLNASAWVETSDIEPFTHSQTIYLTNLSDTSISIELINDNATLFSTYGFSIASVSKASVTIYSIGAPTEDITLTFEVVNPVVSDAKTLGFNFVAQGNISEFDINIYDGTDTSGTVLYSDTIDYEDSLAINSIVVDIPNGDFYLVINKSDSDYGYFDNSNFTATNVDNFTVNVGSSTITMTGTVTGVAIISGNIVMEE